MSYQALEPSFNSSHVVLWSAMCQALSSRVVSTCLISAGSAEPIHSTTSGISGCLHWVWNLWNLGDMPLLLVGGLKIWL